MKKFLSIFLSLHLAFLSVFAFSSVAHAETLRPDFKKPFWGYFDDILSTGMNLPTLLKYVGGVLLNDSDSVQAVSLFDDYLVDNSSRFGVNYQTYEEFVDSVLNAENGVVTITPKGQEIVKEFAKFYIDSQAPYTLVQTSVVNNRLAFNLTNEQYQTLKASVTQNFDGIYFFVFKQQTISQDSFTTGFFADVSLITFDPSTEFLVDRQDITDHNSSGMRLGYIYSDSETSQYLSARTLRFYDTDLEVKRPNYYSSQNHFETYTSGTTDNSSYPITCLPSLYNNGVDKTDGMYYTVILNGFNTVNYPRYNVNPSYAQYLPVSFDSPKVFRVYHNYNMLVGSENSAPVYYTTPEYYMPIASNNSVNVTVLNENIYNSTPTYNEVYNYTQTYYQENGDYPSANITYEYITNYYYAGSDNSTSGGDSGGSGGGGIFDFLGDLGSVLGSLISGLGNLVTNLLSALTGVFDSIANVIPDSMNTFFSTFFSWLPPEWISLITLSLTLAVVFGLIKLIRG